MAAKQGQVVELGIEGISGATRIGEGAFGVVYRAHQQSFGRTVAVKVLRATGLDDEVRRRFERECRALGSLSGHPYIVAVFASGVTASGQPYLVMDDLPGGTLAQRVAANGPLQPTEVADMGVKLAAALAAGHNAGVLHRDIKPENVLVSAYGEPQLVDFGVARVQRGTTTRSGPITGTLAHAAPEVLSGQRADERSDVYSLASTLYALLAGHAPFVRPGEESFHPLLTRILTEDPPDLRPGVPPPLWSALLAALTKDPSARTVSAAAFAQALQEAQNAMGSRSTPFLAPVSTPEFAPSDPDPGTVSVYGLWARPPARPLPVSPRPGVARRHPSRAVIVVGMTTLLALLTATVLALTRDDDTDAVTDTTTTAAPATTTVGPATITAPPETAVSTSVPVTAPVPVTTTGSIPLPTDATMLTVPTTTPTTTRLQTYVLPTGTTCTSQGQLCTPRVGYPVSTAGFLRIRFHANGGCSSIKVHVILNNAEVWVSAPVAPGKEASFVFPPLPAGPYSLELQAEGVKGGCNSGRLSAWRGSLAITASV